IRYLFELLAAGDAAFEHFGVVELGPNHLAVGSELDLPIHRHRHRPSPSFRRPDIERWQAMGKALSPRRSIALAGTAAGLALRLKAAKRVTLRKIAEGGTMAIINAHGCPIYFEVEGPQRAPVLMLSNSLGTTLHMWDRQVPPFTQHFRLVRYDRRGHGRSGVPKGPYTMERLGRDVLAVL